MIHLLRDVNGTAEVIGQVETPNQIGGQALDGLALVLDLPEGDPRRALLDEHWDVTHNVIELQGEPDCMVLIGRGTKLIAEEMLDIERRLAEPRGPVIVKAKALANALRVVAKAIPGSGAWQFPYRQHAAWKYVRLQTQGPARLLVSATTAQGKYTTVEIECETFAPLDACVDPAIVGSYLGGTPGAPLVSEEVTLYGSLGTFRCPNPQCA